MERDQKKVKNDVLISRKDEARRLLRSCFRNHLFSLVPFEIWRDIVSNADIKAVLFLAQTCWGFKELVDNIGENNFNLALLLRREDQIDLAKKYLLLCANNNNSAAMFHVGYAYSRFRGWGLEEDSANCSEWFKKSAELGNEDAMAYYSHCLRWGVGVDKNIDLSDFWGQKALSSNNSNSFAIGFCHYHGLGTQLAYAYDEAFMWFEKSALEGDEFGQEMLANCYYFGEGVDEDYAKALYWFLKSAKQGNAEAQYFVGGLSYHGLGCEKDKKKAIIWWKKSAKQGNPTSTVSLKRLEG